MANSPIQFQLHAFFAFLLIGIWPFTRLVHVFSAPIGYLTRPYIVYRSRGGRGAGQRRAGQRLTAGHLEEPHGVQKLMRRPIDEAAWCPWVAHVCAGRRRRPRPW